MANWDGVADDGLLERDDVLQPRTEDDYKMMESYDSDAKKHPFGIPGLHPNDKDGTYFNDWLRRRLAANDAFGPTARRFPVGEKPSMSGAFTKEGGWGKVKPQYTQEGDPQGENWKRDVDNHQIALLQREAIKRGLMSAWPRSPGDDEYEIEAIMGAAAGALAKDSIAISADAPPSNERHGSFAADGVMYYDNANTGGRWAPMKPGKSYNYPLSTSPPRIFGGHENGDPVWEKPKQVDPYWGPHGPPPGMFYPPKR